MQMDPSFMGILRHTFHIEETTENHDPNYFG